MEFHLLYDIVIILGLALVIILIFQRFKLPGILGFLITGMIVGPHGLNLINAVHEVELLSEIGVIFLLFVIGIEFSLKSLASIKRTVLLGGSLQVLGTIALIALSMRVFGHNLASSIFMGFLICLSSTAIVLKMLQEKGELTAPYGRISVAILIFQDIAVVLMILLTPLLAGQMENPGMSLLILFAKVVAILLTVYIMARDIVPVLFGMVVKTNSRELFIMAVIVLCFATAWLTSAAGLSLALGAFFAGLIISESDYSHQANANILPFREIFISFFFVSVGMLLDVDFFFSNILYIHLFATGVIAIKFTVIVVTVYILRYPPRTVLLTALALFQVGEFAFVLSATGMQYDLLSQRLYQYFLAISIITMGATPLVMNLAPTLVNSLLNLPMPTGLKSRLRNMAKESMDADYDAVAGYKDHLVIVGYGLNGENVAKAARQADIPYVIIELDPDKIRKAKAKQEPVIYGDASNEIILKHVGIQRARVVVVAISSPEATLQIVRTIRAFTETAYVIVRSRYIKEMEEILRLGADEVVPEEFETSIEIFTRVMNKYLVPRTEIQGFINDIRSHNYEMLRTTEDPSTREVRPSSIHASDMKIATLPVHQGKNKIIGKTIRESALRTNFGVTVVAVKRGEEYIPDIDLDFKILPDDILYIFGMPDDILEVSKLCELGQ